MLVVELKEKICQSGFVLVLTLARRIIMRGGRL